MSANQLNRYSQITRQSIREKCYDIDNKRTYELAVGALKVSVTRENGTGITKKYLRQLACDAFVAKYNNILKQDTRSIKLGEDYIDFSRDTVLKTVSVHMNKVPEIKPQIISFDSEGQPPTLIQICTGKDVYLYTTFEYPLSLLRDPEVKKIVCDLNAEKRSFGDITNATDIQGTEHKSLIRCIKDVYDFDLVKSKKLHIIGWNPPFSRAHIDYAVADAIWIWKLYHDI